MPCPPGMVHVRRLAFPFYPFAVFFASFVPLWFKNAFQTNPDSIIHPKPDVPAFTQSSVFHSSHSFNLFFASFVPLWFKLFFQTVPLFTQSSVLGPQSCFKN